MVYCFIVAIIATAMFTCLFCRYFENKRAAKNPYNPKYFQDHSDDEDNIAIVQLQFIAEHTYLKARENACKHAISAIQQNLGLRKRCDMLENKLRQQKYENQL